MVKVRCRTNLDLANELWPDEMPCVPQVGDRIQSRTQHKKFQLELQVVAVTWKYNDNPFSDYSGWYPEVELHMTDWQARMPPKSNPDGDIAAGSITAFYQWYAPLVGKSVGAFI